MYQYHNDILCISINELVKSEQNPKGVVKYDNYKAYCKRGKINVVRQGKGKGNCALIDFLSLPTDWQLQLQEVYGSPKLQADAKPFKDSIEVDETAKAFYRDYRYGDDLALTDRLQAEYSINAAILNAVGDIYTKTVNARTRSGKSTRNFWLRAAEALDVLRAELKHTLPRNPRHFQNVFNIYKKESYSALISKKLGNKNSEKITGDILDWLILEMANTRQSVEMVAMRYPSIAKEKGWNAAITAEAFRKRISDPEVRQQIDLKRHGRKGFRKLYGQSFKLKKSQYRNDIWMGDGTALSWYYKKPVVSDKTGKELRYEPVMATTYIVMDECSGKFLGWSTKEGINKENFEMQLEAFRGALRTAGSKPYQLLFDNQGGHKKTESKEFYSKLAHVYFPTRAYRASGKGIERSFKNFQTLKLAEFPFWSGFGRPSHADLNYAPNMEEIKKNVNALPTFEELTKLLDVVIAEWNELGFNGADSPNFIFENSKNPEERPISIDDLAEMFWTKTDPKKYHAWGINLRLNGEDIMYEVYDDAGNVDYAFRRKFLNQKLVIKYDPAGDYPEIELYQPLPDGDMRKVAVAQKKREASRSIKYHSEGDKAWIEKQMALEGEMMDAIDADMTAIGFNDDVKWSAWQNKISPTQPEPTNTSTTLYGGDDDEGTMEVINL